MSSWYRKKRGKVKGEYRKGVAQQRETAERVKIDDYFKEMLDVRSSDIQFVE